MPPQLTSVSVPFFTASTQLGALHICCVQASDSQSSPVRQLWPVGQGAAQPAPHAGAPSAPGGGHTAAGASRGTTTSFAVEASLLEASLLEVSPPRASVEASFSTTTTTLAIFVHQQRVGGCIARCRSLWGLSTAGARNQRDASDGRR